MSNLKLGVEVISAHTLIPKDKKISCNAFVELHFDDQRFRTSIKHNDPNPVWNETFFYSISDPNNLSNLILEAQVYNYKSADSKSFIGKVHISGTSFVPFSEAVVLHYPLEKQRVFSRATRGGLGLKAFLTDDPSIKSSNPLPAMEASNYVPSHYRAEKQKHTSRVLPNSNPLQKKQSPQISPPSSSNASRFQSMNQGQQAERTFLRNSGLFSSQPADYSVKETKPVLGGGKPAGAYDLVEPMRFLFVRVVKARDLPTMDVTGSLDPFVEVKVGNFKGITKHFEKKQNPEWNEVFAFAKDNLQSDVLEVVLKDKDAVRDDFVGILRFDLNEVPTWVPPDSPLAPEWYRLGNKKGEKTRGELMLAVWFGTQTDESFPHAYCSDAFTASNTSSIRSKVYHSPRLWYVRVNVIEAQDLIISDRSRFPDAYVKIQISNQVLKTKLVRVQNLNPRWNEEFMFVVAEPFEDHLIVSVEDRVAVNKDETIGKVVIPLDSVEKRADDRVIRSRWFHLEKNVSDAFDHKEQYKKDKFATRLHLCICLDGGYHVLDESTYYSSDLRPTDKQLWKPSIGALELGILSIEGLHPMKTREGKGTTDPFCVAKYGHKWVRTRTVVDSLNPKFNEQYTWEVYNPATVITIGVFDNNHINGSDRGNNNNKKDAKIGKVRIRISTLESQRVYTNSYPLLVLRPSGLKKMGELHLAVRFSCRSRINTLFQYSKPLLPKMHYIGPLMVIQQEMLRQHAVNIVAARLSRAEPPLRKEVVEYMSDAHSHLWSMRKSRANSSRIKSVFSGLLWAGELYKDICSWKRPVVTVAIHILFLMFVCVPEMILPIFSLCLFILGLWNYRVRPKHPPHMDAKLSYADSVHPDELDEEFDTFPTSRNPEIIRLRYDRLRSIAGRVQKVVGDIATQGERVQALLSWRDPCATSIFMAFCLVASIVLYAVPFQALLIFFGFYLMRHPKFRRLTPSAPLNFFRRLPAKTDCML